MDIVRFKGGLGNQMFQYALVEALRSRGREVRCSMGFYRNHPDLRPFILKDVFERIKILEVEDDVFNKIDKKWRFIKESDNLLLEYKKNIRDRFFYVEEEDGNYDASVFQTKNCVFVGYFQSEKYFGNIKNIILEDFRFAYGEDKLRNLRNEFLENECYVAVHIRRGDYLENTDLYGRLWETCYYENSIRFIEDRVPNAKLVFFSDDIQWVKKTYKYEKALYIENDIFDDYKPWYDMCLMSSCSHNIIANSSFSWWGAWLNQNTDKIVVAPETWLFDGKKHEDICPDGWIRLKV